VLLRRMSLSRSRVFPGVCTMAHEGVFQGAPRGGAHTSPPNEVIALHRGCSLDMEWKRFSWLLEIIAEGDATKDKVSSNQLTGSALG